MCMSHQLVKFFFTSIFVANFSLLANGQQSVHTAGGDAQGPGGSVAFSLGQIVYSNYSGAQGMEAQGVQQRYEMAKVSTVLDLALVQTPWSKTPNFPSTVNIQTTEGQYIQVPVRWDATSLDVFKRGTYSLIGFLDLPTYVSNPSKVNAQLQVQVLPKTPPRDLTLSNSSFTGGIETFFIPVGGFVVDDPIDQIHQIRLYGEGYDNVFFEIKNNILFWSSSNPVPGRKSFTLLAQVIDRDGNTLEKFFDIRRSYPETSTLEISNTFTPNGDGVNDTWGIPELRFYQNVRIQLFDRGGLLIFSTESPDVRWDGKKNGKEMAIGTYYWVISIGETGETRRGMLNLLRK